MDWKKKLKDIAVRAAKTFLQAFIAFLVVNQQSGLDWSKSVVLGALAAGISALMNCILSWLNQDE